MKTELARLAIASLLALTATAAAAQDASPPPGVSYGVLGGADAAPADPNAAPPLDAEGAPPPQEQQRRRRRVDVAPYLEVAAGISSEFGGDTVTYSTVAAGVDGRIETRRVTAVLSYRYDRQIELEGQVGDQDSHSGVAQLSAQVVPGAVQLNAGALATRTGGVGRASGLSDRDDSVEVYAGYVGPDLSTRAGPVALNASYRLGYAAIDDDSVAGGPVEDYQSSTSHSFSASAGMAPGGQLPFGWTVGGGYVRADDDGEFENRLEAAYVRGDVVVPVSPTLALTAGVGYERIRSSQNDLLRDGTGAPVIVGGRPVADPNAPRLLTYDVDGMIYDGGVIWRPSQRTELQARVGHRYGGTTVVGSFSHRFNERDGMSAVVYDHVETFGSSLTNALNQMPQGIEVTRNPITGDLNNCGFGATPGTAGCFDRSIQAIRGGTFRARGGSVAYSGSRGLWNFGFGAGYDRRRYARPDDAAFDAFGGMTDESFSLFGTMSRRLSRTSDINLNAYASWFDSDQPGFDRVFSTGGTISYNRRLLLDRLSLTAAFGLNHSDDGTDDSTVASGVAGLRYTFW